MASLALLPGNFTLTNFHLKNLVIFDLSYSKISDDWEVWSQIKVSYNNFGFVPTVTSYTLWKLILFSYFTDGKKVESSKSLLLLLHNKNS